MNNSNDKLPAFDPTMFDDLNNMLGITTEATQENPTAQPTTPKGWESVGPAEPQPATTQPQPTQQKKPDYDFEVLRLEAKAIMPDGSTQNVPKKQALFRADDYRYLGSCSPTYNLKTHSYVMNNLHKALKTVNVPYNEKSTMTKNGSRLFHHITFEGINSKIEGENIAPQIILLNCYDGSSLFDLDLGVYRGVCENGMRFGESMERVRAKRTNGLNVPAMIQRVVDHLKRYKEYALPFYNALADYSASEEKGLKIIEDISEKTKFPKSHTEKVIEEWKAPRTAVTGGRSAWGIYNAYTSVITHNIQNESFERGHQLGGQIVPSFEALVS